MLQVASTDNFNPTVPKAHNRVCLNLPFPLQIIRYMSVKAIIGGFVFLHPPH